VAVAADALAPAAQITKPDNDAVLTAPTAIKGTATDANFAYYSLGIKAAGSTADYTEFARGTQAVSAGTLGTLDTTQLPTWRLDLENLNGKNLRK